MPKKRPEETVFDRVGSKLVQVAANLLLVSQQSATSEKIITDVIQSNMEIEASDKEAVKQVERGMKIIENGVRALRESQSVQQVNRQSLEAIQGHQAEGGIARAQDEVADLAHILGHKNYRIFLMGDADLWAWLLDVVDTPAFESAAEALAKHNPEKFLLLQAAVNRTVNEARD